MKEEEEEHHHHEKKNANLWVEGRPHDCDFDPNSKSPLASCRQKYPPAPSHESYDLDRP